MLYQHGLAAPALALSVCCSAWVPAPPALAGLPRPHAGGAAGHLVTLPRAPAPGPSPNPDSLRVPEDTARAARVLVHQLGSPDFQEREAATRGLAGLGRLCYDPLREAAATAADPEVRMRAGRLLPKIEREEMAARFACFARDKAAAYDHDVPGWKAFRGAAGNDPAARKLFAELWGDEECRPLLLASQLPAAEVGRVLREHYKEVNRGRPAEALPSVRVIAAEVFLETLHGEAALGVTYDLRYSVIFGLKHREVRGAMGGRVAGPYGAPLRRLVTRWLDTRESAAGTEKALAFAREWDVPGTVRYAGRLLAAPTQRGEWWVKEYALVVIANNAQPGNVTEVLEAVGNAFGDSTPIQVPTRADPELPAVQLRDFALGVALRVTKQDPKAYGLSVASASPKDAWNPTNYFFQGDGRQDAAEKRAAAFKKFEAWAASRRQPAANESSGKQTP